MLKKSVQEDCGRHAVVLATILLEGAGPRRTIDVSVRPGRKMNAAKLEEPVK